MLCFTLLFLSEMRHSHLNREWMVTAFRNHMAILGKIFVAPTRLTRRKERKGPKGTH